MKKISGEVIEKNKCFGCGACFNICPVNAIEMKENEKGFLTPVIDKERCINCSLCDTVCPYLNRKSLENKEHEIYAMTAGEEVRNYSSSGGAFSVIAEYIIENGGVVCGAAYSENYDSVKHIIISDKKDLYRLRGSKYVQSETGNVYKKIKELLQNGKRVFFTGCPCQVDGLKNYLKEKAESSNLFTMDIICHGVPSPKAYRKYLVQIANGKNIKKVDFREKSFWGWGTATSVVFDDDSVYRNDCYKDEYWKAFLNALSTREVCSECLYANPYYRNSDITVGDFWGINELSPEIDYKKGVSLLMINSEKGKDLIFKLRDKMDVFKKEDFDKVINLCKKTNGQFIAPRNSHWAKKRFFDLLQIKDFKTAYDDAVTSKYDVGIVGWWYNENYGGTLTYYALHQTIRNMGLSVLMISKVKWNENYRPNVNSIPYRFALKNYNISKNYYKKDMGVLNNHCKTFISGSDQLFNPTLWEYSGPEYFLDFADSERNIISYASSFGNGYDETNDHNEDMGYWLHRFNSLSVREDYGVEICENAFGIKATKVMDPVFLCGTSEYKKLIEKSALEKKEPYLLSFILDPNKGKKEGILYLANKMNVSYINMLNAINFDENERLLDLPNTKPGIDIEDWLFYYKNADFIITDSFHGTCFAIIFRKQFISIANKQRGEKRFISLLNELGLMDRLVMDVADINTKEDIFKEIDYDRVYEILTPKVQESMDWLKKAIFSPNLSGKNKFKMLEKRMNKLQKQIFEFEKIVNEQKREIEKLRER